MRTKNAKRLWPVPATLAVMALAALLAFGLMAVNGAQPAAAQAKASCPVAVADTDIDNVPNPGNDQSCMTTDNPATVGLPGSLSTDSDAATKVWVYAADGTIAGGSSVRFAEPETAEGTEDAPAALAVTSALVVDVDAAEYNLSTAAAERVMSMISVAPISGKSVARLYIYYGSAPTATDFDHDGDNDPDNVAKELTAATGDGNTTLRITFLGSPAVGKDAATDFNKEVDDETTIQCRLTTDTSDDPKIVAEGEVDCPDTATQTAISPNPDVVPSPGSGPVIESRSKLVVHRSALTANPDTVREADVLQLLDGSALDVMMTTEDVVTIHAVIEDAVGRALEDTEVSFRATATPSDILSASALSDTEDAEAFGTADTVFGLAGTDAVATFSIDDLADAAADGAYRVVVEVMAGDLSLGTVNIFKPDKPTKIIAGIFSAECFTPGGTEDDPDYEAAKFNMKNTGCEELGMSGRFGANEMFFVKAHLEDALDNKIGDGNDIDAALADEDSDLLGDADIVAIADPVEMGDPARAWMFTVDAKASLIDNMITVSTDTTGPEDAEIPDVTLTAAVAGPPASYEISGPDNIPLRMSEMFTVSAKDEMGGIPHITSDENDMVAVSVLNVPASNVRGLTNGMLMLDDEGVGMFTVHAFGVTDGQTSLIVVGEGGMETQHEVTFGAADTTGDMLGTPMDVTTGVNRGGALQVSWTKAANAAGYIIIAININDVNNDVVTDVTNDGDDENWNIRGLTRGATYDVYVAATASGGRNELSEAVQVTAQ